MLVGSILVDTALAGPPIASAEPIPATVRDLPGGELAAILNRLPGVEAGVLPPTLAVPPLRGSHWEVLDALAKLRPGTTLAIQQQGQRVRFVDGQTIASRDGPFRVAVQGVTARQNVPSGRADYDVALEAAWEPRLPVFRLSSVPTVTTARDDRGQPLTAAPIAARTPPLGSLHTFDLRLQGLTRASQQITQLQGEFIVTAAPHMLTITWDELPDLPSTKTVEGVRVTLTRLRRIADMWELTIAITNPEPFPVFESFESWTSRNTVRLIGPDQTPYEPVNFDETPAGRGTTLAYRFPAARLNLPLPSRSTDSPEKKSVQPKTHETNPPNSPQKSGWRVLVQTPAPLREYAVRFDLTNIPLP